MQKILKLSWNSIFDAVDALCYSIERLEPRTIIGVSRGGLVPATLISHKLGLRMDTIKASAYEGTRRTLQKPISIDGWKDGFNTRGTVIVDDILDSGDTLQAIRTKCGPVHAFHFVTLVTKSPNLSDTYYARVLPEVWVKFPWEGDET